MVKNSKGGKHAKKGKNQRDDAAKRELVLKLSDQEYGQITKSLGDRRFEVYCFDGKTRSAHVPGRYKRRLFFVRDDIVLVQLRDYQDEKADLIHKYIPEEIAHLKRIGEIPTKAGISEMELLDEGGKHDVVDFAVSLDDI
jgi:translation initiation factor 1A